MKKEADRGLEIKEILIISILVLLIATSIILIRNNKLTGFVTEIDSSQKYVQGELIVKYKDNVIGNGNEIFLPDKIEILVYDYLEKPIYSEKIIKNKELYNLKFDERFDNKIENIINDYKNIPEIEYVEPNYLFEISVVPSDVEYNKQYGLKNIFAEEAWNLTIGNKNIVIAIIDTGVEWAHEDLFDNIWNNSDEGCDENFDLDNNSYKGDCRGYDFVDIDSGCTDSDCNKEDNDPIDTHGHGTHVSGIASAVSNNNLGTTGVCWNCNIMPVRGGYKDSSGNGAITLSSVVKSLYYSANNNATVISMSFGGSDSATLQEAINYSSSKSILVASAGNSGKNFKQYPCGYDNVICIASTNSNNQIAGFSNYGDWIDLAAPGTSILSTSPKNNYKYLSGTSMSTPMVAGAIGLIKGLFNLNQTEIKNVLNNTGTSVDFNGIGISMINVYSAILSLDDIKPNVTLIYPENNVVNLTLNQTFLCEARDWQLKNLTIQIWNSTNDFFYSETKDISGIYNQSSFNVLLNEDNYKWGCLVYDSKNNYGYSNNFSLLNIKTSISLVSPLNNTYTNKNEINFNCSAQTEPIKNLNNITFLLWNSTNLIYTKNINLSGTLASNIFNYNFSYEDNYLWTCRAYSQAYNNTEFLTTANFTIVYDTSPPVINLLNPDNGKTYHTTNNQEIEFNFAVNDENEIKNCSLIINNEIKLANNSVDKSLNQDFKINLDSGNYEWKISCIDKASNIANSEIRSFTITSAGSEEESSGEGGQEEGEETETTQSSESSEQVEVGVDRGESGEINIESSKKTYFVSNEQFLNGYSNELGQNDEIKFLFQNEETFQHSLIINLITKEFIEITVKSEPINLKLGVGEEKKLNLTTSNYDFYVKLNSINENRANLTIQLINEEIQKSITGLAIDENEESTSISKIIGFVTKPIKLIGSSKFSVLIFLVIAIIIVSIIIFLVRRRYNNQKIK